jgi:CorA-like Mg2+ transporter protein
LCNKIFNTISIQEANNAIRQGQSIKFISILATVFVPVSLFSSLFGMNIQELGVRQGPAAWAFLAVAIPGTMLVLAVAWILRPLFGYVEQRSGWLSIGPDNIVQADKNTPRARGKVRRMGAVSRVNVIDLGETERARKKLAHALWPGLMGLFRTKKHATAPYNV